MLYCLSVSYYFITNNMPLMYGMLIFRKSDLTTWSTTSSYKIGTLIMKTGRLIRKVMLHFALEKRNNLEICYMDEVGIFVL